MSLTSKILLPLCDIVVPKEFITKEAGFVDARTIDLNFWQCREHLCFMYDLIIDTSQKARRAEWFLRAGIKPIIVKIDGKWYAIYHVRASGRAACEYRMREMPPYKAEDLVKLIQYWGTDKDMCNLIFYHNGDNRYKDTIIGEADKEEPENYEGITIQKKPEGA